MEKPDKEYLERLIDEYNKSREFADKANARVDELKGSLRTYVKAHGTADDKGHVWLPAINHQLKHEKRTSVSLNTQKAEDWAKENGVWDKVKKTIEVLDEDALVALLWQNQESGEMASILDSFYTKKDSWAFKVVEGKSYDDE